MTSPLNQLLVQANDLREQDKLEESLHVFDQAIIGATTTKNYPLLIEALHGKLLTWKHFYLLKKEDKYRNLASDTAKSALKICLENKVDNKLSVCYFRFGEIDMLFENYKNAIKNYQKSIDFFSQENAQKGDYVYHLGEAIFRLGNIKKGEKRMLEGLSLLQKYEKVTDPFLINVWISGCYLCLADLTKSKKYLKLAKEIINSDPRLIIRKRQLISLTKKL